MINALQFTFRLSLYIIKYNKHDKRTHIQCAKYVDINGKLLIAYKSLYK